VKEYKVTVDQSLKAENNAVALDSNDLVQRRAHHPGARLTQTWRALS